MRERECVCVNVGVAAATISIPRELSLGLGVVDNLEGALAGAARGVFGLDEQRPGRRRREAESWIRELGVVEPMTNGH